MKNRILIGLVLILLFLLIAVISLLLNPPQTRQTRLQTTRLPTLSPTPSVQLMQPPISKILPNTYHVFQTFNNCGPAALSMALSYYGISESQKTLGESLRPYQNPQGDNDDKSVILFELAQKAKEYGLLSYHRPNGTIELIKLFVTYDMPVLTTTWLKENEDIGHYRLVKGYDDETQELIQDDSLQGKNLRYTYDTFNTLWKKFNYEYLVLVPKDKQLLAEAILKEDIDPKISWRKAVLAAEQELVSNPGDIYARFNLSVASYYSGDYEASIAAFEEVQDALPSRTLWYQIEPIRAYFALGRDTEVLLLTENILNNQNRAFSELYILRGKIFEKRGEKELAREAFEKAVFYNKNLKEAKEALESLES